MQKIIDFDGAAVSYSVFGSGQPVMLLHGFGETYKVWTQLINFLKDEYRFIVPELPGTGEAEVIPQMTLEGMAVVMKHILDTELITENNAEVTMIGHSMGGYITLAFAEAYPMYLKAFGLFHSSAFADSDDKKETRKKGIKFIKEHGAASFLKTTSPNLFSPVTKEQAPGLVDDFIERLPAVAPEVLMAYYEAMMARPDRTQVLKDAAVPVLFILGQQDTAIPFEDGLRQVNLPQTSSIHVLRHSGHMGMLEETAKSNAIIKEFLEDL